MLQRLARHYGTTITSLIRHAERLRDNPDDLEDITPHEITVQLREEDLEETATDYAKLPIGAVLRELRGPLSLRQVERLTGVAHHYLSPIEQGKRRPSTRFLQKLADFYGVSITEMLRRAALLLEEDELDRQPDPGNRQPAAEANDEDSHTNERTAIGDVLRQVRGDLTLREVSVQTGIPTQSSPSSRPAPASPTWRSCRDWPSATGSE